MSMMKTVEPPNTPLHRGCNVFARSVTLVMVAAICAGMLTGCDDDDPKPAATADTGSPEPEPTPEPEPGEPEPTPEPEAEPEPEPVDTFEPGAWLSPLVPLQRLQGENNHLHVDEVRLRDDGLLLQCSYTFGVVDATNAASLRYLSQNIKHVIPGDERQPGCINLASEGDLVFTTHRGNLRNPPFLSGWDITDRAAPVQLPVMQEEGIHYEGVDVAGGHIYVALHTAGIGVYRYEGAAGFTRVGSLGGFTNTWGVTARGDTLYVAAGLEGLVTVDISDPTTPVIVGRAATGGQARKIALDGDIAYVAAGSAGLVVVDVADRAAPRVIGRAAMPGTAMRVAVSEGHAFVAAWNDARVYSIADPAAPRFVGAVRLTRDLNVPEDDRAPSTSRILGIAARGNDVIVGNWHVLYSYRLFADRLAPDLRLPEAAGMVDVGPTAVGESRTVPFEIVNQGTAELVVVKAWMAGDAFTVEPTEARLAPGARATLSVTFTPTKAEREEGYLQILSDDPAEPLRTAFFVGNQPGLGVGMPLPETTAVLLDGTAWSSVETGGQVMLLNYFATFCPVCASELPDVEERFWQRYRDDGLAVVALNAHDDVASIGEVEQYCEYLKLTFTLGLEQSETYEGLTQNFAGLNPFPVDVLVDKAGMIRYVAREYDPDALTAMIDLLLAE